MSKIERTPNDFYSRLLRDHAPSAIRIVVPGEPKGFRVATKRGQWNKGLRDYRKWKDDCVIATEGFGLDCPVFADSAYPVYVHTSAFYSSKVHCDPQNTSKGYVDAIMPPGKGGGDKYAGTSCDAPLYDYANPRTLVEIRGWLLRKYEHLVSEAW